MAVLQLSSIARKDLDDEIKETIPDLYDVVKLHLILPDQTTVDWEYPLGESVQTIKKRLIDELNFSESTKLFLEQGKKHLLDPLSLNDFPSIKEQSKQGSVRILVEGNKEQ
eukprot:TRINITY_DN12542_c0_g1_i1.p1 TRINITY_DN12542_c0_g1~~TRINITY_DN12542_c0_g1_i1.p1  ORF type:complete len:111 (-),score=25.59 TRINITY_DN12542_c0_g1_i1:16-348(-)